MMSWDGREGRECGAWREVKGMAMRGIDSFDRYGGLNATTGAKWRYENFPARARRSFLVLSRRPPMCVGKDRARDGQDKVV